MTVFYKPYQSVLENKDKKRLFHPRVVYTSNVDTNQLAREIAAYSSLTAGDVLNTLSNLLTVMTQHLQASETVTLDGLGSFRLVMNSGGRGVESAEEVSASQARLTVRFTPASTRHADRTLATRSMVTGAKFARYEAPLADDSGTAAPEPGEDEEGSGEAPDPIV